MSIAYTIAENIVDIITKDKTLAIDETMASSLVVEKAISKPISLDTATTLTRAIV